MTIETVQSSIWNHDSETMHPLDNSAWKALTTRQADLARSRGDARAFTAEICLLSALREPTPQAYEALAGIVEAEQKVHLALEKPYETQPGWKLVISVPALQMVYEGDGAAFAEPPHSDELILELGGNDASEMMELTHLTKPGPFSQRTHELGNFIGIRREGRLIAMAGERLKVPGFTEVSAVCTHPDHVGHGYARILMSEIVRRIFARGETPFLHVRADNSRPIGLYQRLGFRKRMVLQHTVLQLQR